MTLLPRDLPQHQHRIPFIASPSPFIAASITENSATPRQQTAKGIAAPRGEALIVACSLLRRRDLARVDALRLQLGGFDLEGIRGLARGAAGAGPELGEGAGPELDEGAGRAGGCGAAGGSAGKGGATGCVQGLSNRFAGQAVRPG